ncbi:MAG: hypothetical protein IKJ33_00985 [Clostridia bacterium]|nr:hypothetical protein [Clostridia bacterium]
MNRLFGMMRYNKQLLVVFILSIVDAVFVLGVGVFDIVQVIQVTKNAVSLSPLFVPINIALVAVVAVSLIAITVMFVIKIIKGKNNESKKD